MGIFDSLFGNKKAELATLKAQIEAAEAKLVETENKRAELYAEIKTQALNSAERELEALKIEIDNKRAIIVEFDEKILLQSFGLYKPLYDFAGVDDYQQKLKNVREEQKRMIDAGTAVTGSIDWTVDGSGAKGRKMVNDIKKLLLRAFNCECEFVTWKVKYNNFDSCKKRIENAYNAIQKMGVVLQVEISERYLNLKIEELHLALEYQQAKQREKERQRELKEQQREEAALAKEIEETRRKIEKEQTHYLTALKKAQKQFESADYKDRAALSEKISELKTQLTEIDKNLADIDYREANQRAGYVYIISNIGSFGENVLKIGMTRRLDPMERINELGGASVPFNFDVHALIFSDDAPKLEAALHRAFESRKINLVNTRREFFYVGIEEIEKIVRENYDKSIEFIREPDAQQFRESKKIRADKILAENNDRLI